MSCNRTVILNRSVCFFEVILNLHTTASTSEEAAAISSVMGVGAGLMVPVPIVGSPSDDELESLRSAGTQVSSCPSSSTAASGGSTASSSTTNGAVTRRMFKCHFCKQLVDSREWYSGRHR